MSQKRTLGVLIAAQIAGSIGIGASVSVGAVLAADLSGSAGWSGSASTMSTLGAALWALPLARVAAARGRRLALSLGWSVSLLGAVLVIAAAVARSFPLTLPAMLLMGAGNAANLQSRFAATDLADERHRGRSLALVVWSSTIGAVAGPNLTKPGASVAEVLGIPPLAGPFVFSAVAAAIATVVLFVALRPDPLARNGSRGRNLRVGWEVLKTSAQARFGVATVALSHTVMVSLMAMTPVHMQEHGAALTIVGLTISLHIAGMFALSPLMGWIADRWGRVRTALAGQAVLVVAVVLAATSGDSMTRVTVGLIVLGAGWSMSTVAGSTLVADSVELARRPAVQGVSDLLMSLVGAIGAALSGVVLSLLTYSGLSLAAGLLVLPVLLFGLAVRDRVPSRV
ncbi:MFS transporter [Kutzneria buriramensis]|uniref:Putative MFS family arabinose efflux permease n=1 Tax=Kutzneria buriramensis TaxID=1045776 RepID=A0A3E0HYW6_9PSEU|nr:MFS transporter [Kutzneria buriramensis]REH51663.1 putative MFS family arabinose efflux permease [Kutzneria buriramensis]